MRFFRLSLYFASIVGIFQTLSLIILGFTYITTQGESTQILTGILFLLFSILLALVYSSLLLGALKGVGSKCSCSQGRRSNKEVSEAEVIEIGSEEVSEVSEEFDDRDEGGSK